MEIASDIQEEKNLNNKLFQNQNICVFGQIHNPEGENKN